MILETYQAADETFWFSQGECSCSEQMEDKTQRGAGFTIDGTEAVWPPTVLDTLLSLKTTIPAYLDHVKETTSGVVLAIVKILITK